MKIKMKETDICMPMLLETQRKGEAKCEKTTPNVSQRCKRQEKKARVKEDK